MFITMVTSMVKGLIVGIIGIIMVVTVASATWTPLSNAFTSLAGSTIPFASLFNATSGIAAYAYAAGVLLAVVGLGFAAVKAKQR